MLASIDAVSTMTGNAFLAGGGETGARMRGMCWESTGLGPPETWPQSLKTAVRIILTSRQPMFVWWGPRLINLYNDPYISILGGKHPEALGQMAEVVWQEIWDEVGPRAAYAIENNEGTYDEALLLIMERHGYLEETYFTFSYSPVPNDDGSIGGIICANTEETAKIVGERRIALLHNLATRTNQARTFGQACAQACEALGGNSRDIAFSLLYLHDGEQNVFRLAGRSGIDAGHPCAAEVVQANGGPWELDAALKQHAPRLLDDLATRCGDLPTGAWSAQPLHVATVPISGSGDAGQAAVLVVGLNRYRLFDDDYRRFIELVAAQIAASLSSVQAYEEERRRAETLAELDRAKTAFFSNVSHELRTPLTLMLAPLEDLASYAALDSIAMETVALIRRNGERLLRLVNGLLDFSRIEAGKLSGNFARADLPTLTADIASTFRSLIERAGLEFRIEVEELAEPAFVDRDMWEKILLNLLSNAFKHTFAGRISVSLRQIRNRAVLEVADTGVGIAEHELPRIFDRFHRVDGAASRTHEGTGIGLALVHELVKLHGGQIAVDSKVGEGSRFLVTIPLGRQHLRDDQLLDGSPPGGGSVVTSFIEESARWLAADRDAPEPPPSEEAGTERARILIADDNADMREYVERLLGARYQVRTCADGEAALREAGAWIPDIVITDVMMPQMDGFELLRALRADPRTESIAIVLLSARAGEEARIEGLQAGADEYIVKPFHPRELQARVGAILSLSRLRADAQRREMELRAETVDVLESIADGFVALDADYRFVYMNAEAERLNGVRRQQVLGKLHAEVYPDVSADLMRHYRRAMDEGVAQHFESFYAPWKRWFQIDVYPRRQGGIAIYYRDVTEQKRALAYLEETDRRKDEFLATLAHELRNPLAPLRNGLQILNLTDTDGEEGAARARARGMMDRQLTHMVRLIDDLLDVSRINRNKLELSPQPVDLATVIRNAVETSQPLLDAKGHQLVVSVPLQETTISADPVRLAQVFSNLLNNAAKYTPPGGHVTLNAFREGGRAIVRVTDDGAGIPRDMLNDIFDMFVQVRETAGSAQGGLGIGLTLVKRLVALHGGTVTAESGGLGLGSSFTVALPLLSSPRLDHGPTTDRADAARPTDILVVDDNIDAADSLAVVLSLMGHRVKVAHGGEEALRVVDEFVPRLVLLDLGMPGMDGYQTCGHLKALLGAGTYVVALTGWGQARDRDRTAAAGFDDHIVKPATSQELRRVIVRAATPSEARASSP